MGRDEFFSVMMPHAQRVSDRTGIDPRLVLAQAALETGYGKSAPNNNFFGIKSHGRGGGSNLQTKEFEGGRMVTKSQSFRGYSDPGQSFDDYADFLLRNKRYQPVLNAGGLDAQIAAMGNSGYATDPNYASKLAQIAGAAPVGRAQGIADDAMAAIGKQPMQRGTQTAIGGSGADTMNTPQQGLLGQIARPDEKVGGLLGMMFGNMTPDRADQLRANIGGLMGINNQGMVDGARGRMRARSGARENDLNYNRQQQQTEQERQREAQRTAQSQEWIAQNHPDLASAVQSGVLTPQQAYAIANKPPEGAPAAVKALEQRALLGGLKPGTPEYQQFMLDGGAKSGLALSVGSDGSVSLSTGGASAKALTEGQSKDTVYATRAEGALTILDQYDSNLAGLGNRLLDADPTGLVRGKLQDTDYQLARQAGDEFLQAILRKDTGAAITEPEQELYGTTYLPQPGDGPEVIAQKKQSRKRAIEAIKAGMPPSAIVAKEMALLRSGDAKPEAADGATDADGWQVIDGVRIRVKP